MMICLSAKPSAYNRGLHGLPIKLYELDGFINKYTTLLNVQIYKAMKENLSSLQIVNEIVITFIL